MKVDLPGLLRPVLDELGYSLWGCEFISQGKFSVLRIYIDRENGIGIEDCETASHHISALLDVEDPVPGHYTLEVSSPGLDRPLFYPEQYQKYIGEKIRLKLYKPINNKRKFTAKIVSAGENTVVLACDEEQLDIEFSNIAKANLTV